jgi:hypothetical protein
MEQMVARQVHTLEVVGSNPASATNQDAMSDFEIWVYRGLAIILITIIGYGIKKLITKIDELINEIQKLALKEVEHEKELEFINDRLRNGDNRLNDHATRIRALETKSKKVNG